MTKNHAIGMILGVIPLVLFITFVLTYGTSEFPYGDANVTSAHIAIKTHDNTLTLSDLFTPHNGHRIVFTHLITALLTPTTRWDNTYEILVNVVLGLLNTGLLILIFKHHAPREWGYMVFPIALFTLSVDQALSWLGGVQSAFHFALFFTLLAILALQQFAHKPLYALTFAIISAYCASFSTANGLTAWGVIIVAMVGMGYRQRWHYALILIMAIICAILFFHGNISTGGAMGQVVIPPPVIFIQYTLTMLGRPFINDSTIAPLLGFIGIALFFIVSICLWRDGQKKVVGIGAGLAVFSLGTAGLIALTRHHFFGMNSALLEHYQQAITPFWIAIFAMLTLMKKRVAVVLMVMLIGAHGMMLMNNWDTLEWQVYGKNGAVIHTPLTQIAEQGACFAQFPFHPNYDCFGAYPPYDYAFAMSQIAIRGLSGYADIPITNRLIDWAGEKIILVEDRAWKAVQKAHFWLNGISQNDIFYIVPQGDMGIIQTQFPLLPQPPQFVGIGEADSTAQTLRDWTASSERVWYITTPIPYVGEVYVGYRGVLGEQFEFVYTLELGDGMIASLYQRRGE
ncbi:MAG: hypothetical protein SFZ02_08040 [bacterium]|nr:hypothetical protein [bacterium]